MKAKVNKVTIQLTLEDALTFSAACVVTITDPNLTLSPEIAAQVGPEVAHQTHQIGYVPVGDATITPAGNLTNTHRLIHAVAPRWTDDNARAKLAQVTWRCLELAEEYQAKSIAIPPVSTGTLGYPIEACARVMIEEVIDFTFEKPRFLKTIVLCAHTPQNAHEIFAEELRRQIEALDRSGEGHVSV